MPHNGRKGLINKISYLTLKHKIKNAFGKLTRVKPDRRVMVFLFFVIISTIFWFLSALGRQYTSTIRYPVRYTNFPENRVMVGELPSSLELTVNAHGYTLLRYYVSRRIMPIVFDVNSFSLDPLPDTETSNFYILTSVATNRVAGQLGSDIEILDIRPDTLFFNFTDMTRRRLRVRPVTELVFDRQFMIKGNIGVEPDSVLVSGPASVIDTMQFVPTRKLARRGVSERIVQDIRLEDINMLEYSQNSVTVTIPVEQFTEASIRVPVELVNLPDTLSMKTFPPEVTVSYLVALTDYERVNPQSFRITVDYKSLPAGTGRLPVNLMIQPDFVRAVRFSPESVDFIIER